MLLRYLLLGAASLLIATCGRSGLFFVPPFDPPVTVAGVGERGQGAGVAVTNFDGNPRPELLLMAYDEEPLPGRAGSPEENTFRYRILWNLNFSGIAERVSNPRVIQGVGWEGQGGAAAVGNLDADVRPEIILMAYDNPDGANSFRYKMGWNINKAGAAERWDRDFQEVAGVGFEAHGAGMALTQLDQDYRPDLILVAYDAPSGGNRFRYRVGRNLDGFGRSFDWTLDYIEVPGVGRLGQGAGVSLANLDEDPRPEMVLMAYDSPKGGNSFRGRIGWNLDSEGVASEWTGVAGGPGLGAEGSGAGIVFASIDDNARPDVILMAYDNPPGPNEFRYRVGFNIDEKATPREWGTFEKAPGVGRKVQGAGVVLASLDGDPRPEIVALAYDNPPEVNSFRYRVGFNLDANHRTEAWSETFEVPGVGWEAHGAGVALTNLDGNTQPELIVAAYDSPSGMNNFRYRVVWNIHSNGEPSGWADVHHEVPGIGFDGEGAGVTVTNLDSNPRPDLILMAYDAPDGPNRFGYKIGLNLDAEGVASSWSPAGYVPVDGVGHVGRGAGIASANLDGDPRPELVVMAYDPTPKDRDTFRYRVGWNLGSAGMASSWDGFFRVVAGVGREAQGADLALSDLEGDGDVEITLMAYEGSGGVRTFRYKVVPAP